MNDRHYREEIVRLEEQIDELAAKLESCRKFILAGRILVIGGGAVLLTASDGCRRVLLWGHWDQRRNRRGTMPDREHGENPGGFWLR